MKTLADEFYKLGFITENQLKDAKQKMRKKMLEERQRKQNTKSDSTDDKDFEAVEGGIK